MNTLLTIVACLLGSSLLQGIGFYLYSTYYKRKHLNTVTRSSIISIPDAHSRNLQASKEYRSPTKQDNGQKTFLPFDTFKFKFSGSNIDTTKPNSPVISFKAQSARTPQSAK